MLNWVRIGQAMKSMMDIYLLIISQTWTAHPPQKNDRNKRQLTESFHELTSKSHYVFMLLGALTCEDIIQQDQLKLGFFSWKENGYLT